MKEFKYKVTFEEKQNVDRINNILVDVDKMDAMTATNEFSAIANQLEIFPGIFNGFVSSGEFNSEQLGDLALLMIVVYKSKNEFVDLTNEVVTHSEYMKFCQQENSIVSLLKSQGKMNVKNYLDKTVENPSRSMLIAMYFILDGPGEFEAWSSLKKLEVAIELFCLYQTLNSGCLYAD